MGSDPNKKTIFQIAGWVVAILLLCSGWVFGIVRDVSAQEVQECKSRIEKIEENTIPNLEDIVRNHDKIIPVIEVKLDILNKLLDRLLKRYSQ